MDIFDGKPRIIRIGTIEYISHNLDADRTKPTPELEQRRCHVSGHCERKVNDEHRSLGWNIAYGPRNGRRPAWVREWCM
jgi:hypothetical protein